MVTKFWLILKQEYIFLELLQEALATKKEKLKGDKLIEELQKLCLPRILCEIGSRPHYKLTTREQEMLKELRYYCNAILFYLKL